MAPEFNVNDIVEVPESGLGRGIITRILPEPDPAGTHAYAYYVLFPHRDFSQFYSARHLNKLSAIDLLGRIADAD